MCTSTAWPSDPECCIYYISYPIISICVLESHLDMTSFYNGQWH